MVRKLTIFLFSSPSFEFGFSIIKIAVNTTLQVDYFQMQEVLHIHIKVKCAILLLEFRWDAHLPS